MYNDSSVSKIVRNISRLNILDRFPIRSKPSTIQSETQVFDFSISSVAFLLRNWCGAICICKFDLLRVNARESFVCINNVDNSQYRRVYCNPSTDSTRSPLEILRRLKFESSINSPIYVYLLVFLIIDLNKNSEMCYNDNV